MEMAELGMVCPECREIINKIMEGVDVTKLPSHHILKRRSTGEMVSAYDELYTVDMGRGELVYLGTKLLPPSNARSNIVESAHQGPFFT